MNGSPLVSVVIPVHNRAHVLGRAIQSVREQTFQDLELLVVDDGSSDGSADAAATFGDARVRVLRLPDRGGVGRARNTGILHARASLVAFLDSDDEWRPEKLARQVDRLRELPATDTTLVSCRYVRYNDLTQRVAAPAAPMPARDQFGHIIDGRAPLPSSILMPRAALAAVGGLDEALPAFADYELWLRLADASIRFVELSDVLVVKHEHGTRQISTDPDVMLSAFQILDQKWRARILQRGGPPMYRRFRSRLLASIQYVRVRQAVTRGDRLGAWHHWLDLCRHVPWSRRYAVYGLGLAALGVDTYDALARVKDTIARGLAGSKQSLTDPSRTSAGTPGRRRS